MGGGDGVVNWSEVPGDVLVSISKRLDTVIDYFSLAQVCKSWKSIALSPYSLPIPLQPPFLLLAESKIKLEGEETLGRRFVGLEDNKLYDLSLPQLHQNRCIGSTGNWLFLINLQLEIHMFNPFTKTCFGLPSQSTLPEQWSTEFDEDYTLEHVRDTFIGQLILSSTPKSNDLHGVVAMVVYGSQRKLAIARPGDKSWAPLQAQTPAAVAAVHDAIFFNNQFYSVNCRGKIAICDIHSHPPQATMLCGDFKAARRLGNKYYLVQWLGELLLVAKYCPSFVQVPTYKTKSFEVYKLRLKNLEWEEVKNLGQHSLFLGFNTSVSLASAPSSTFRRNCVYYTDDNTQDFRGTDSEGGHDMGVFDLTTGTISPHYTGTSTSLNSPPFWIIPNSLAQL